MYIEIPMAKNQKIKVNSCPTVKDLNRVTKNEQALINKTMVKNLFKEKITISEIAKKTSMSYSRVYAICNYE